MLTQFVPPQPKNEKGWVWMVGGWSSSEFSSILIGDSSSEFSPWGSSFIAARRIMRWPGVSKVRRFEDFFERCFILLSFGSGVVVAIVAIFTGDLYNFL